MKFANARAGDSVAIPYDGGDVKRATIDRLTPTQVIVGERRYRRDNGHAVGEQRGFITPWTDEHAAQAARYEAGMRLSNAAHALGKIATGWGVKIPKDHVAANALSETIESYLKAAETHGNR
jgi:hypothetical protein